MLAEMDAVILCGGLGKRLRSINDKISKVMVAFDGDPFLDILLNVLKKQGLKRFILCTGHKAESIEEYYSKKDSGVNIVFSRETEPLGTGGALKNARSHIKSQEFLVFNGDCYCEVNFKNFLDFHKKSGAQASLVAIKVPESRDYGTLKMADNGKVLEFLEKGIAGRNYINAGRYCFTQDIFSVMPEQKVLSLEYDIFPKLVEQGFYAYKIDGQFFDIGTPERFHDFKLYYNKHK